MGFIMCSCHLGQKVCYSLYVITGEEKDLVKWFGNQSRQQNSEALNAVETTASS